MSGDRVHAELRRFGHAGFRPGQERAIRALLGGRDVLALFPTGSGKSLVYQLASQLLPGPTLVVSPLIALMQDQIDHLARTGVAAESVSSARSHAASEAALARVEAGDVKLLYVAPERLDDEAFAARIARAGVSLLVVDEAHAISEWGHDFRPAYLALGDAAALLGAPVTLALTATATPWVRQEIVERLHLRRPDVVVHGNDRPNLFLEVHRVTDEAQDRRVLERLVVERETGHAPDAATARRLREAMGGTGIVYAATTRGADEAAGWLREWGIPADSYHGRRRARDRTAVQEAFMRGAIRVVAATNAFGLGVDKPDVRFVIHRDVPPSLESYWQEAGRAGRDGELARCVLVYRPADLGRAAFLAGGGQVTVEDVERVRQALLVRPWSTRRELATASGVGAGEVERVVRLLVDHGLARERRRRVELADGVEAADVPLEAEAALRAYERSRLEMMRGYADTLDCRRRYVLNYLGEEYDPAACRACDDHRPRSDDEHAMRAPFALGDAVIHRRFGAGVVERVAHDAVTVLFDDAGYRTFAIDLAVERGLLRRT